MGRTMAVVLFTDLVGSTELRGRLGEERPRPWGDAHRL
jgi:class 3 adenylate cyclase